MAVCVDLKIFELLASRLCHDIVGPIGAVNNGMELLQEDDEEMAGDAIELASASARQAADALQFYRLAYGMAGTQVDANGPELAKLAEAYLEKAKSTLAWPDSTLPVMVPDGFAKLLLNLIALAAEALPRGGTIGLAISGGPTDLKVTALARGEGSALRHEVAEALEDGCDVDALTPRSIQGYFTKLLVARAGGRLEVLTQGDDSLEFVVELSGA